MFQVLPLSAIKIISSMGFGLKCLEDVLINQKRLGIVQLILSSELPAKKIRGRKKILRLEYLENFAPTAGFFAALAVSLFTCQEVGLKNQK